MGNKEKWGIGVDLFKAMEKGSSFVVDTNYEDGSEVCVMDVIKVDWPTPLHRVVCAVPHGHSPTHSHEERYGLEKFLFLNAATYIVPEPEKSEAEKLWESLEVGKYFWLDNDKGSIRLRTVLLTGKSVNAVLHYGCTVNISRKEFIGLNATATRPKTEREVELDKALIEEHCQWSNAVSSALAAESRVKELEDMSAKQDRKIASLKEKINRIREHVEAVHGKFNEASASVRKSISELRSG